jgi:hypothetical protein
LRELTINKNTYLYYTIFSESARIVSKIAENPKHEKQKQETVQKAEQQWKTN